jgi:hypothetical protein
MSSHVVFLVGTGRCGSQMLGRFLAAHPRVLYLDEFFGTLRAVGHGRPPAGEMDGRALWRVLSRRGTFFEDHLTGRVPQPQPLIARKVLRSLPDPPGDMLDRIEQEMCSWPKAPATRHLRTLMSFLAARFGRDVVIERSGSALTKISMIEETFPGSRYLHLARSGPDTALSMSQHAGFRLGEVIDHLSEAVAGNKTPAGLLRPPYDIELIKRTDVPLERFGRLWSDMACKGVAQLLTLHPEQVHTVSYEDVVSEPVDSLTRIASFVGVPAHPKWLTAVTRSIVTGRAGSAKAELDTVSLRRLVDACAPGARAVGQTITADATRP